MADKEPFLNQTNHLHRQAEHESENRYRVLVDLAVDGIILGSHEGIITEANTCMCAILGMARDEFIGKHISQLPFAQESLNKNPFRFDSLQKGEIVTSERVLIRPDGSGVAVEMRSKMMPDGTYQSIYHDITERKLAEKERALNTQRIKVLLQLNQMTEATLQEITDFALEEGVRLTQSSIGYLAFLNEDESVLTMHAWSKSAMAECAIADRPIMYPVRTTGLWGEAVRQRRPVITNDYTAAGSLRKGYPEGHVAVRRHMNIPVFVGSGIVLVAGVGNKAQAYDQDDVQQLTLLMEGMWRLIERKRVEDALRENENKYRLTFNFSPDAVNINRLDDGLFVDINEGFTRATGFSREEVIGRMSSEINIWHDPADRQKLVQGLREKGYFENLEAQFRRKDGSLITALMSARIISMKGVPHIISITRDITERKQLEGKLQQVQKFEAIGTLAGGVAHDFNNLLMGIQGRSSLISLDLEASHPHSEHILAIEEYIRSATNLTKQLLGFARGGKYEVKPIDMNQLVSASAAMFGRTKKEIRIHAKCQTSSLVVEADRGQIEQVLLNMYVNAWQAMPADGGEMYLETKIATLDEAYCKPYQVAPGRYVKVSITDTGIGMDDATRLRIFDPFFTTKEKSRGTGLGLASAFGIIKNHGGMITVYSEIGHGTTFNIYLPVSDKEVHREISKEARLIKGSSTILLVDDEEMIIEVGQAMLERLGYRLVVSRGGREAIQAITDMGAEIDLVILDMIMPGMDGGKTFDRIRELKPGMPVLLSSGYAISGHAHEIMDRGCNGFIQKPYTISELSNKVRQVLDERKI
ncbi:MAG: PAS domain S-box protein [Pseudomonadota bacterium]